MKLACFISTILLTLSVACTKSTEPYLTDPEPSIIPGKIVFVSDRETEPRKQVFIMNGDGSDQIRITHDSNDYLYPAFSPDGSKILFYSAFGEDGSQNVFTAMPRISPDGSKITFMSYDFILFNYAIFIMDFDGQNQRLVTDESGYNVAPIFTPEGNQIIFRSHRGDNYDIYEMNLDGSNQINLTNGPGHAYFSQFSQDGSKIMFNTDRSGYDKIWMMNRDGSNQIQLTDGRYNDYYPRFQPLTDYNFLAWVVPPLNKTTLETLRSKY